MEGNKKKKKTEKKKKKENYQKKNSKNTHIGFLVVHFSSLALLVKVFSKAPLLLWHKQVELDYSIGAPLMVDATSCNVNGRI